jgi:hypothetical protein
VPLIASLDRAVSRLLIAKLAAGTFEIDGPELLSEASDQLVADGHATVLGARKAVLSLTGKMEG